MRRKISPPQWAKKREIATLAGDQANALKEKILDSGAQIHDWAMEGVDTVRRAAQDDSEMVRQLIDRRVKNAKTRAENAEAAVYDFIQHRPIKSVLLAFAAGYVIGRMRSS